MAKSNVALSLNEKVKIIEATGKDTLCTGKNDVA
jgi:hypothetical protein